MRTRVPLTCKPAPRLLHRRCGVRSAALARDRLWFRGGLPGDGPDEAEGFAGDRGDRHGRALAAGDQLSAELREYLEVGYVSLADYVDGESVRLMREYARAGDELAADARLAREKVDTGPWRRLREQGRLAGETAKAISEEAARLREEFRSWHGEGREAAT